MLSKLVSKEFLLRSIVASILVPVAFVIIHYGSYFFQVALLGIACISYYEFYRAIFASNFSSKKRNMWCLIGSVYLFFGMLSLGYLRTLKGGEVLIYWLLICIWATDTGAYITGNMLKGPKLAPSISPNKTWSGAIGGAVFGILVSYLFDEMAGFQDHRYIMLSVCVVIISQVGDLLESYFKRATGIKDSSNIIPGHGGLLDRLDSVLPSAMFISAMV